MVGVGDVDGYTDTEKLLAKEIQELRRERDALLANLVR